MQTLVYQKARSVRLANGDTANLETPFVRPSVHGVVGLQDVALSAIEVNKAVVRWNIVPVASLAACQASLQTTRYAMEGGWNGAGFLATMPTLPTDVSGELFQNRGVIEHDGRYDGLFKDNLAVTNWTGSALTLYYIVSVFNVYDENMGGPADV